MRVWRARDLMPVAELDSTFGATELGFSTDGRWLAASAVDLGLRVWEVASWELMAAMRTNGKANALCWLPDSNSVCVGSVGGIYRFAFVPPAQQ